MPQQFKGHAPKEQEAVFLGNIIFLKEKRRMRKSYPRQVDKKSRGPQGERVLEFSRKKKGQTFFFSFNFLYFS